MLEYAAAIWGGLPQYLIDELENIQARSLRILDVPSNTVPPLKQRRDTFTTREHEKVCKDITHPCSKHIPNPVINHYKLRMGKVRPHAFSYTERHELSFIPRAISLL